MRHAIWMAGLSLALSGLTVRADVGQGPIPQPEVSQTSPDERAEAQPGLPAVGLEADGYIRVAARDPQVLDILREVAASGRLQVLVDTEVEGKLPYFAIKGRPESVLRALCYKAHLEVRKHGDAFLVRPPRADAPEPPARADDQTISVNFKKMPVRLLVETLVTGTEAGVVVEVEGGIEDNTLPLVKLDNATLKQALDSIALLLDAEVAWENGRYILRAKPQ